jgi:hypothetical protein
LRIWAIAALGLVVACGSTTGTPTTELELHDLGRLAGQVFIGPICPVEVEGQPCPVPPELYERVTVVVTHEGGARKQRFPLDGEGLYAADLAASRYRVTLEHDLGIAPGQAPVHQVSIVPNQTTIQDFQIDTGIR